MERILELKRSKYDERTPMQKEGKKKSLNHNGGMLIRLKVDSEPKGTTRKAGRRSK